MRHSTLYNIIKNIGFVFFITAIFFMASGCAKTNKVKGSFVGLDVPCNLLYTAYVQSGPKKIAIINGKEYSIGDNIENSKWKLVDITSLKATVYNSESEQRFVILHVDQKL